MMIAAILHQSTSRLYKQYFCFEDLLENSCFFLLVCVKHLFLINVMNRIYCRFEHLWNFSGYFHHLDYTQKRIHEVLLYLWLGRSDFLVSLLELANAHLNNIWGYKQLHLPLKSLIWTE